jgi:hypothetical protein
MSKGASVLTTRKNIIIPARYTLGIAIGAPQVGYAQVVVESRQQKVVRISRVGVV